MSRIEREIRMKSLIVLVLFCFLGFGCSPVKPVPVYVADKSWLTNFEEAKKIAAKEKKAILMDFAGSDWCAWCIKLDNEIFAQPEFKAYAKDNLVLVLVDFPSTKELPAAEKAANEALMEKYGVEGFPTVILLDSKGGLIAKTSYREGAAAAYVDHIKELLAKAGK